MFNVTKVELPGVNGLGEKVTVVPDGTPAVAVNTIGVENPPVAVVAKLAATVAGDGQAAVAVAPAVKANPFAGIVIVKLVFEISKKILPIDSTLTLAVVEGVAGIVTASLPSLAVLATNTVGKVNPPSVESKILTLAQLTGAAVVLFTSHVMV